MVHFVRHARDEQLHEFDSIVDWALNNELGINPTVMDGTSGHRIEEVHSAKLLGLTIDDNMNWDTHCRQVLTVARQRLHCMHVMRRAGASAQLLRTLYCALIRSAISHAFPAWCNVASTRLMSFVKLESRICRILTSLFRCCCRTFSRVSVTIWSRLHFTLSTLFALFLIVQPPVIPVVWDPIIDAVLKSTLLNEHDCIPVSMNFLHVLTVI